MDSPATPNSSSQTDGQKIDANSLSIYGFGFVLSAAAFLISQDLPNSVEQQSTLILFMFPILVTAMLGGLRPGLATTAMVSVCSALLMPSATAYSTAPPFHVLPWSMLIINGILVSLMSDQLHQSRQREREKWQELAAIENRLWHSDTLFQATFDYAAVGMALIGLDGRWLRVNRKLCEILGYSMEELLDNTCPALTNPDDLQADSEHAQMLLNKEIDSFSLEKRYIHKNGHFVWVNLSVAITYKSDGSQDYFISVIEDITERKQTALLLEQSEAMKRAILDSVSSHIAVLDKHGTIVAVNKPWLQFVEHEAHCANENEGRCNVGANYLDTCRKSLHCSSDDAALALKGILAVLNNQNDNFKLDYDCSMPEHPRWFSMTVTPLFNDIGGAVVSHTDITERKLAELALWQIKEDLSATLQAIPDLLFEIDASGRYINVKTNQEDLLVAPSINLLGHTVQEMLPAEAAQTVMDSIKAASRKGTDYGRTIILPLQGSEHCFELSVARKLDGNGLPQHFIVLSRDITERRKTELALRQQTQQLAENNAELHRFNQAMIGRELNMIELKMKVNQLSEQLDLAKPYPLAFLDESSRSFFNKQRCNEL
ncbi:hypothetical protein JCM14076_14480 [Methylosoma difficile]